MPWESTSAARSGILDGGFVMAADMLGNNCVVDDAG
jgi:hypothetical protein